MYPWRCAAIVLVLILAGFGEAVSILSLFPLLGIVIGGTQPETSAIHQIAESILGLIGLDLALAPLLGLMVAGALLKAGLTLLAGRQVGYAAAQIGTDMRMGLIRSMMDAKWSHFASQPVGQLSNAVSSEASRSSAAFLSGAQLVASVVQTAIYLAGAFMVSVTITLLALGVGAILILSLRRTITHVRSASDEMTRLLRSLSARFADGLQGIKPLKAMAQNRNLLTLLEVENKELHATQEKRVFNKWLLRAAQEPVVIICLAVGFYFAHSYADIGVEALIVMGFLFSRLVTKIGQLQSHYQALVSVESAFLALHGTIEQAETAREILEIGGVAPTLDRGIVFDGIRFQFPGRIVLDGVSLSIPAGQMTLIVGPSGAGKTTIIDLVVGLFEPDGGRILLDGIPLQEVNLVEWRKSIGYVPQELFLFHGDLRTNVTLGDSGITDAEVEEALRAAAAWDFVCELPERLDTIVGERGLRLSGGQRQRIAIARALVRKPRLLILDEATTALDPKTESDVCEALKGLLGDMTILVISHQLTLMNVADNIYRIHEGQVRRDDVPQTAHTM